MAETTPEPTEAELEQLKEKHGKVLRLAAGDSVVYVKKANRETYKRFRAQAQDDTKRAVAATNLVNACLVWPGEAEREAMFDEYPALVDTLAGALLELAGLQPGEKVEKKAV